MAACRACGAVLEEDARGSLCPACRNRRLRDTWKRQMRNYAVAMAVGLLLVLYAYGQFHGGSMDLAHAPVHVLGALVLGGLGLMGGLFGFGLALFFSIWHKRSRP